MSGSAARLELVITRPASRDAGAAPDGRLDLVLVDGAWRRTVLAGVTYGTAAVSEGSNLSVASLDAALYQLADGRLLVTATLAAYDNWGGTAASRQTSMLVDPGERTIAECATPAEEVTLRVGEPRLLCQVASPRAL